MKEYTRTFSWFPIDVFGGSIIVELLLTNGLPTFHIVGMASQSVSESRERIRGALRSSGIELPLKKILCNLSPADIRKTGTHSDLAIAACLLSVLFGHEARNSGSNGPNPESFMFIGEVGLSGEIKPITGALAAGMAAKKSGLVLVLPKSNEPELALIKGLNYHPVSSLRDLSLIITGRAGHPLKSPVELSGPEKVSRDSQSPRNLRFSRKSQFSDKMQFSDIPEFSEKTRFSSNVKSFDATAGYVTKTSDAGDFGSILGSSFVKFGLAVAAAGKHPVIMMGPAGSGKTTLARNCELLLPEPMDNELAEITIIHSTGEKLEPGQIMNSRPFRAPHHTISEAGLLGGTARLIPGEVSLAHRGILFLDEITEFSPRSIETLRQVITEKRVTLSKSLRTITMPADFWLICAGNPCRCGRAFDGTGSCSCTQQTLSRFSSKLSGPFLDRFDLMLNVRNLNVSEHKPDSYDTARLKNMVDTALDFRKKALALNDPREAGEENDKNGKETCRRNEEY